MTSPYFTFVEDFFRTNGCPILEKTASHLKVQLSNEMDEEIMNRPFYWHYIKKMERKGDPMQLTFTDVQDREREGIYLHAGTPKLQTLYQTAIQKGKTARLYECVEHPLSNGALTPWLVVNIQLHFRGRLSRVEYLSLGLNLINGAIIHDCMDRLEQLDFRMTVSDYTFPITPIISLLSGQKRLEGYVESYMGSMNHDWAKDSHERLKEEEKLIRSFYESGDMTEDQYEDESKQLVQRYKPRISMNIVNGGVFYLTQHSNLTMLSPHRMNKKAEA